MPNSRSQTEGHLIEVVGLKKYFETRSSILARMRAKARKPIRAVDGVSFHIDRGEGLGLIGESGCGKTTTAMLLLRLINPSAGKIFFDGLELTSMNARALRVTRRRMQMVFQDPYESLNPGKRVSSLIAEPLVVHRLGGDNRQRENMITGIMEQMGLVPAEELVKRYPHELSGGQRQRVAIARALILQPVFIIADEPTSMLDVSVRAGILNLLRSLRDEMRLGSLFITHDLALARYMCERIAVLYNGKIVETAKREDLLVNPIHPYTRALVAVASSLSEFWTRKQGLIKELDTDWVELPDGCCRFHPRCPHQHCDCERQEPELVEVGREHWVACHRV